jgi:hypothetical protein
MFITQVGSIAIHSQDAPYLLEPMIDGFMEDLLQDASYKDLLASYDILSYVLSTVYSGTCV